jgi:hypothetical protein
LTEPSILLLGLSHVGALDLAQHSRVRRKAAPSQLTTIYLFPKYDPLFVLTETEQKLHDDFEPDLRRIVKELKPRFIIGSFWSNQHYFASMANSPRRFDFVLPSEPDLPLGPDAEVIPFDLMRGFVRNHFRAAELLIAATQRAARSPVYLLPAPPPTEAPTLGQGGKPDALMAPLVAEHGLAPGWLRYKFWRLCEAVHQEKAAAARIEVLPIPAEAVDERGFRRPEYVRDWIHANAEYGELLLQRCDALLTRT